MVHWRRTQRRLPAVTGALDQTCDYWRPLRPIGGAPDWWRSVKRGLRRAELYRMSHLEMLKATAQMRVRKAWLEQGYFAWRCTKRRALAGQLPRKLSSRSALRSDVFSLLSSQRKDPERRIQSYEADNAWEY